MSNVKTGDEGTLFKAWNMPLHRKMMNSFIKGENIAPKAQLKALELMCSMYKLDINDFYQLPEEHLQRYCYYKKGVFKTFQSLDETYLQSFEVGKAIQMLAMLISKSLKEKDFETIFLRTEQVGHPLLFETFYSDIPDERKYGVFIKMYTHQDYGFESFNQEMVQESLRLQPNVIREQAQSKVMRGYKTEDSYILIYRGVGEVSTSIEKTLSWTLSETVAHFFANRFSSTQGKVLVAKVKVDKIIDYLTARKEEEVLVHYEDIQLLNSYQMVNTSDELVNLMDNHYMDEYQFIRGNMLKPKFFHNPDGVHGMMHIKRVMMHCLSLSKIKELTVQERSILLMASLYHDIGRKHDWGCEEHGLWSIEKRHELNLPYVLLEGNHVIRALNEVEIEIVHFLMEFHCKPDEQAVDAMKLIKDKEIKQSIERLFPLFKDADGLDRVRLGDLNIKYLRTDEAKGRTNFAEDLLQFLE